MVDRPALLRESLRQPERRAFLQACGYPVSMGTGRLLDELSRRMRSAKAGGFPHEIGLFLGYPLEDVTGFIAAGGAEYRCSGCWKKQAEKFGRPIICFVDTPPAANGIWLWRPAG